jgi:uncharacterized low-complexity protein
MTMKKHALLVALASALALGGVTAAFAQEAPSASYNGYDQYNNSATGQQYVPGYGNTGAGSGPGEDW